MSLAACSNSEEYAQLSEPVELQVTAGFGANTRTAANEKWTDADVVMSVTAVGNKASDSNHADNVSYKIKSGKGEEFATFEPSSDPYVFDPSETSVTFAALTFNSTILPSLTAPGSGKTDYTYALSASSGNLPDIRFATASAGASDGKINFTFNHILSKLTVVVKKSDEITSNISTAKLSGYIASGTLTVSSTATTSFSTTETSGGNGSDVDINTGSDGTGFIVYPGTQKIKVSVTTADNNTYAAYIDYTFVSGIAYKCEVTLKPTGLTIVGEGAGTDGEASADNSVSIVDWDDPTTITGQDALMSNN
jgi:hypothetical protein